MLKMRLIYSNNKLCVKYLLFIITIYVYIRERFMFILIYIINESFHKEQFLSYAKLSRKIGICKCFLHYMYNFVDLRKRIVKGTDTSSH